MHKKAIMLNRAISIVLLSVTLGYVVVTPFTKVEESFNLQAVHDILYHGRNLSKYDHQQFPGVVPRSFVGPLVVATLTYPLKLLLEFFGFTKLFVQYAARMVLGSLVLCGLFKFLKAIEKVFGKDTSKFCAIITVTQFHLLFYASRPLPNIFALTVVLPALASWLNRDIQQFVCLAGFGIIIFRFELVILFGICLLISLFRRELNLNNVLYICTVGLIVLVATVGIDSYFWGRWLWPEGEVMWFNVVLNKSSSWGTSPWHWYFTSALPRCLLTSAIFIPWGLRSDSYRTLLLLLPATGFVCAFSFLPHKELRFIIYTIPMINAVAACGYSNLYRRFGKSLFWKFCFLTSLGTFVINFIALTVFLAAAEFNYPGGNVMKSLHAIVPCEASVTPVNVHICNLAAQTGVSRFSETCPFWRYNKTEHIEPDTLRHDKSLTHVIIETGAISDDVWRRSHRRLADELGYNGIGIQGSSILPFPTPYVKTEPVLSIWQRNDFNT
uniref:Mannosyltransferase n=1 Tax=Phallusia mammillata TaxID=59560 RepID=A0A6F9D5P8_9ASCI|nr:dol-P-Man:Man(7)GlcNAc(2)-PP-Dol alpha-1,6-mannosyltransferase [Phallusia mammillata]